MLRCGYSKPLGSGFIEANAPERLQLDVRKLHTFAPLATPANVVFQSIVRTVHSGQNQSVQNAVLQSATRAALLLLDLPNGRLLRCHLCFGHRIFPPKLGWLRYRNSRDVLGIAIAQPVTTATTAIGIDDGVRA